MKKTVPQLTIAVLALSFVSCTVAPALVFAEDTVTITNVARSSVSTGGHNGQDGEDGVDGKDGTDGASGKSGVSITNVAPGSAAEVVTVISTVDGHEVLNYESDSSTQMATVTVATSSAVVAAIAARNEVVSTAEVAESRPPLAKLFAELQLIIFTYVSYLF